MTHYLSSIWNCRYFWLSLVKIDLRTRYRRSVLGLGWSLLQPLAMTTILCAVFGTMMKQDLGKFGPYVFTGLATWNYLVGCALQGCQCFHRGESYIRQYPAPMAIYPLRTALAGMVHYLIALVLALILTWILNAYFGQPFAPLLAYLPLLLPNLVLLFLLGWALATITGFANVFFQDAQHLSEIGLQLLFYATPIIYMLDNFTTQLANRGIDVRWFQFHPVHGVLQLIRVPITGVREAGDFSMLTGVVTVFAFCGVALWTLRKYERQLIFRL
jgi:ABC-type polysaccharide/polyol phosphate export permease